MADNALREIYIEFINHLESIGWEISANYYDNDGAFIIKTFSPFLRKSLAGGDTIIKISCDVGRTCEGKNRTYFIAKVTTTKDGVRKIVIQGWSCFIVLEYLKNLTQWFVQTPILEEK